MKILLCTLFVTVAFSFTASAAPVLVVRVNLLEHSDAGDKVVSRPTLYLTSGKQGTVASDKFEYNVTATLLDHGTVDVSATLTEHDGKKALQVVDQRTKAKLGFTTEFRLDKLVLQTTTSLAK